MEVFILFIFIVVIATQIFIRYDPRLYLMRVNNKIVAYLWYNSMEYDCRKYIKLFEI